MGNLCARWLGLPLLADQALVRGRSLPVTTKWIDVQTAASGVAGVDGQLLAVAVAFEIHEDAFDALFMEFIMLPKGDQIA